jgi:hypothetical protein
MRLLLTVLVLVLAVTAPARARMEVGMQDDQTLVYGYHDRALALKQFKRMGGTTVRINIEHRRNSNYDENIEAKATVTSIKHYDAAIDAVVAAGLKPQLTLIWRGVTDPILIGGWMHNVAARYADRVRRFSILNEPDLVLRVHGACRSAGERSFIRRHPGSTFVYRGSWRAYDPTLPHGFLLHIACLREARGREYREIVEWAARSIRAGAPGAQVLAGETSGQVGLEWFVRAAHPRSMPVAGWAHHPWQLHDLTPGVAAHNWGIGNIPRLKRLIGLPLYFTEFGYPHPHSSMDRRVIGRRLKQREVARVLPRAWRLARRSGIREMLQYQWYVKPKWRHEYWETALLNKDNGKTTPAYRALRSLILGWRR